MHPLYERANELSKDVYDSAIEVARYFGAGTMLESVYQKCLAKELELRGHKAVCEVSVPINYKGYMFDENLRIDILVDDCLVIECKAVAPEKFDRDRFRAQTLTYLKLMNLPLGMLINFGASDLGHRGISRVILAGADQ